VSAWCFSFLPGQSGHIPKGAKVRCSQVAAWPRCQEQKFLERDPEPARGEESETRRARNASSERRADGRSSCTEAVAACTVKMEIVQSASLYLNTTQAPCICVAITTGIEPAASVQTRQKPSVLPPLLLDSRGMEQSFVLDLLNSIFEDGKSNCVADDVLGLYMDGHQPKHGAIPCGNFVCCALAWRTDKRIKQH